MSILDTFTFLFESNADGLRKGATEAEEVSKNLEHQLSATGHAGADAAHHVAAEHEHLVGTFGEIKEKGHEAFHGLAEAIGEVALAWQGILTVENLVDTFLEQAEKSAQLGAKAKSLNVPVEELDKYSQAVSMFGGNAEAFGSSIEALNKDMARFGATGTSRVKPFFDQLGISMADAEGKATPLLELLPKIHKAIEGMDNQQSAGILKGMHLDEGTIRMLQASGEEFEEVMTKISAHHLISKEDAETGEDFVRSWKDLKQTFTDIAIGSNSELLPALTGLLHAVSEFVTFLTEHKNVVKGFFIELGAVATVALGVMIAMNVAALPWIALGVAVAAVAAGIAVVIGDIMDFEEGNESVTAKVVEFWNRMWAAIKAGAVAAFNAIVGFASDIKDGIVAVAGDIKTGLVAYFDLLKSLAKAAIDFVIELFTSPTKAFADLKDAIGKAFDIFYDKVPGLKAAIAEIESVFTALGNTLMTMFVKIGDAIHKALHPSEWGSNSRDAAGATPAAPQVDQPAAGEAASPHRRREEAKAARAAVDANVATGQAMLSETNSPLMSQTSNSIQTAQTKNVTNNITIGATTINTQATDPVAIKKAFDEHSQDHYDAAMAEATSGVSH